MSEYKGNSGVSFATLLTLLFIGLKLGHVIDWSWWWVVAPLWIPPAIMLGVLAVILIVGGAIFCIAALYLWAESKRTP